MNEADVSTAAEAAGEQPQPQPQAHAFGAFAYERACSERECRQVEQLQKRLAAALDGTVHVWVRDARPFGHGRESQADALQLRLHASLPVAEVRDMIQDKYEAMSRYCESVDGPLQLLFDGRTLEDGKLLAEYLTSALSGDEPAAAPRRKWPPPFAGILWVVPFRPASRFTPAMWANAS